MWDRSRQKMPVTMTVLSFFSVRKILRNMNLRPVLSMNREWIRTATNGPGVEKRMPIAA